MKHQSALLVLDMINPFSYENGSAALRAARGIAGVVSRLAEDFRRRNAPCIYVNDNFGQWKSDLPTLLEIVSRSRGEGILGRVAPTTPDLFVLKPKHSAFYQTPLPTLLESLGVRSLVLCGIETDSCIMATAMDAHMRDYAVRAPSNACASASVARHRAAALIMRHNDIDTRAWHRGDKLVVR